MIEKGWGSAFTSAIALGAMLIVSGCVPYGGAPVIAAHSERVPIRGYSVASLDIISRERGVMIHGRICRTDATAYPIRQLSVEHLNPNGELMERTEAHLYGMSSWRKPACGYYSAEPTWQVTAEYTVRVGPPGAVDEN